MKILFDNLILDDNAVLTSTGVSDNYPLSNLKSRILTKRTQSLTNTLEFTIDFTSPVTIDCFAFGYTNGSSITVKGITQDINYKTDIIYFTKDTVSTLDVSIIGTEPVYLGSIGVGIAYKMPNPLSYFGLDTNDTRTLSQNKYGISFQSDGVFVNSPNYVFKNISLSVKKEIENLYLGIGSILWLDVFEENRDYQEPKYCTVPEKWNFKYADRNLFIIEAFLKETN
jgi:hypothetical protein